MLHMSLLINIALFKYYDTATRCNDTIINPEVRRKERDIDINRLKRFASFNPMENKVINQVKIYQIQD